MVAPGYEPTPDDDNPSAYQPGGRRHPLPMAARYNWGRTKRGTRSRAARYAIHRKKVNKRRRYTQMPLVFDTINPPDWWLSAEPRLQEAGWETGVIRAQTRSADNRKRFVATVRCRRPGGAWYYPESARDIEWLIASTRVREARG